MFLIWLDLLPQMQAFTHRLFGIRGCDTFLSQPLYFLYFLKLLEIIKKIAVF